MSEFEKRMIAQCSVRLQELEEERVKIKELMKLLGHKRSYRRRNRTVRMGELDSHRRERLRVVTTQPVTRDEAKAIKSGERTVAAQT